jgi:O-antigen ligase
VIIDKGNIKLKHFIFGFTISVILIIVYGIITHEKTSSILFQSRLESVTGNPNVLAVLISFAYLFSLHLFISENRLPLKLSVLALILFLIYGAIRTQSRQGIVLIVAGTVLYIIIHYIFKFHIASKKSKLVLRFTIILLIIIALIFIGFQLFERSDYYRRFSSFINFLRISSRTSTSLATKSVDLSIFMRLQFAKYGFKMWEDNPITGVGLDNFRVNIKKYWPVSPPFYSHNNYIELLSTTGIFSAISYYTLYFFILIRLFSFKKEFYLERKNFNIVVLLITIILSLMIAELFTVTYCRKYTWILLVIVCGFSKKLIEEKLIELE